MLSRIVGDLAAAGLLQRVSDPEDRRAALVQATSAGHELVDHMRAERTDALNAALAEISQEDSRALDAALPALERLADVLKERDA
jgi:DNA-binding MarR family transcriptional regulator